jgi:hypothetical protein
MKYSDLVAVPGRFILAGDVRGFYAGPSGHPIIMVAGYPEAEAALVARGISEELSAVFAPFGADADPEEVLREVRREIVLARRRVRRVVVTGSSLMCPRILGNLPEMPFVIMDNGKLLPPDFGRMRREEQATRLKMLRFQTEAVIPK